MRQKQLYVTPQQAKFLEAKQIFKGFVGGRGTGKSTTIAYQDRIRMNAMPRSKSFLAGPYLSQVVTKTLPAYLEGLKYCNLLEYDSKKGYGHYVVFKRPPESWPKPYHEVRDYSKVITFCNGRSREMISLYGSDSARGGSYDDGDVDESALCDKEDIDRILIPSLRGNLYRFDTPLHYQLNLYTSPPWLPSGQYVYEYEDLQKEFPDEYFFIESCTRDNKAISEEQIKRMQRTLPQMVFEVEVEGKRISKLPNSYYPTFNDKRHCVWDTSSLQFDDKAGLWLTTDKYLDGNKPLEVSFDFNAAFTSMIIGQQQGNEQRIDNNLFVKEATNKSLIRSLLEKFINEHQEHKAKHVDIYGDRNGNNKSANSANTNYEEIIIILKEHGWSATLKVEGLDSDHKTRHQVLEELLSEAKPSYPKIRINANKCKYLIYSIQNSPIMRDFKKNKSSEQSEAIPQEKATHLSDCFDYLIFRKFAKLVGAGPSVYIDPIFAGR